MELIPVDHDPFAEAPRALTLTPIDHDPFAPLPRASADVTDAPAAGLAGDEAAAVGRGIITGIPIAGPYLMSGVNRAVAGVRSLQHDTKFSDELRHVEDFGKRTADAHPWATTGGEIGGGVVGTLPLVAAAPAAFGAGGGGMAARAGASAVSGGVLGGADTAVRTGGDFGATRDGGIAGTVLGAASPLVGAAAGRAIGAASQAVAARAHPVPGIGNAAAGKLVDDLGNSGGAAAVRGRLAELGPEAMLLDASPSFQGRAQGLAVLPDTRETVTAPLVARSRQANARLGADVDTHLGPATDPAAFHAGIDQAYARDVPPLYQRSLSQPVTVDTSDVLATIGRLGEHEKGGAQAALSKAWRLLHTEADVPGVGRAMVPDRRPEALHSAKEALDAMIATVQAQQGSAAASELRALSTVRRGVNGALEAQVPGYSDANRTAQLFFQRRDAFDQGQTLLNGGREAARPAQVATDFAAMPPEVAEAHRLGLRAEIDRLLGTKLNDRVALQGAIQGDGDFNRARMSTVFGERPTAGVVGAVERERAFDEAHNRIVNNSMTEMRKRSADDVAVRDLKPKAGDLSPVVAGAAAGLQGAAMAYGVKGLKLGANAVGRAEDMARNRDLAQAVTFTGDPLQTLLDALGIRAAASQRAGGLASVTDRLTRSLLQSQGDRMRRIVPSGLRGQ